MGALGSWGLAERRALRAGQVQDSVDRACLLGRQARAETMGAAAWLLEEQRGGRAWPPAESTPAESTPAALQPVVLQPVVRARVACRREVAEPAAPKARRAPEG